MAILSRKELLIFLAVVAAAAVIDSFNDLQDGAHWPHVLLQLMVVGILLAGMIWLIVKRSRLLQHTVRESQLRLEELQRESAEWRAQIAAVKPRLGEAIDRQFNHWQLTQAEQEVARLVLKGLSNKEIATVRQSSEPTVKQQMNALYRKSGLESRAQILAYFLEDLF